MGMFTKFLLVIISMFINIVLWQNCAPAFQSNTFDGNREIFSGITQQPSGTPEFRQSPSKQSYIINQRKFVRSNDGFNFKCSNNNEGIQALKPGKLTRDEIKNTIRDVLGVTNVGLNIYPTQFESYKFAQANLLRTEDTLFSAMETISENIASSFAQSIDDRNNPIWRCDINNDCYKDLIEDLPKYVWRKKLTASEILITTQVANYEPNDNRQEKLQKLDDLVTFLIRSPQFIIKNSLPKNFSSSSTLDAISLLNRLSFFFAASAPSPQMHDKYSSKSVLNTQDIRDITDEILSDGNIQNTFIKKFLSSYLGYDRVKNFDDLFAGEKISDIIENDLVTLSKVFTNNEPLANLVASQDNSILTNKSFAYSSFGNELDSAPIKRGTGILSTILCEHLPSISQATEEKIAERVAEMPQGLNNIEVMEFHRSFENCAICHNIIDPPAIGLEVIGPFGNIRDTYPNGDKIDPSGSLGQNSFNNLNEYLEIMSKSIDFKSCFANHLVSAAMSTAQTTYNSCLTETLFSENENIGLKDLVYKFVTSKHFVRAQVPTYPNGEIN